MKKKYIEILRNMATMAVVMIHICMTEVVNSTINEIGHFPYVIYSIGYALVRWAVPVFIMITGTLLLQKDKKISEDKIKYYLKRSVYALFSFGMLYAIMENVFNYGFRGGIFLILRAFLDVLQMKSWDHLWYLYFLIGLYIMTPFTKAAVEKLEEQRLWKLIKVLYIINYIIPMIDMITGLSVSKFWIAANGYYTLYLIGYYITLEDNKICANKEKILGLGLFSMIFMCMWDTFKIINYGDYSHWLRDANCLIPFVAIGVYIGVMNINFKTNTIGKIGKSISECSFGIYLIHPFFINLLYKVLKITPRSMPIVLGIIVLFTVVFVLSWLSVYVLKKMPFFRKIL